MAALVLVIGGAKLDAARPLVARAMAVAIPIVPIALGVKRVEGGSQTLERVAGAIGWVTILAAEACVAVAFFHVDALAEIMPAARVVLYVAAVAALAAHTLEAQSLGKARFAGYAGIAIGYAVFLSGHVSKDAFSSVFGAFFVGVLIGGAGLLLGELLGRAFKKA